jgi:hypothetical protein
MASHDQGYNLWGDAHSFDVIVYEDRQQKCFFIQISNDEKSYYLQGDNLAADEVIFLAQA